MPAPHRPVLTESRAGVEPQPEPEPQFHPGPAPAVPDTAVPPPRNPHGDVNDHNGDEDTDKPHDRVREKHAEQTVRDRRTGLSTPGQDALDQHLTRGGVHELAPSCTCSYSSNDLEATAPDTHSAQQV